MAAPNEKLADSLAVLKSLQDQGVIAIRSRDMTRTHRERLLKTGFLLEVMKGWYLPSHPSEPSGDSSSWYASFWGFCSAYLNARLGEDWCLYPEQSLKLYTGDMTVPRQLLVKSSKGRNKPTPLLHGTTLFDARLSLPRKPERETLRGLRIQTLASALIDCAPGYFRDNPVQARAALAMVKDASELLDRLLEGGHSVIAGRLAGALRNMGRDAMADTLLTTMRAAGYAVREEDPFKEKTWIVLGAREHSPAVNRIRLLWASMREPVIQNFPQAPGAVKNIKNYLKQVDDIYVTDAYHSLSIEGYKVTPELIARVSAGKWNPDDEKDKEHLNALAARGYWQAFQQVKKTVEKILNGENPGDAVEHSYRDWYLELFAPCVNAGIIKRSDLAGFRNGPVYIRKSMHVPPDKEAVRDMMPTFVDLLREEENAAVRVVLGHFIFVYIHPYIDGNGRMGRFLMNAMMASGGYPWTVIPVEKRANYMTALESASVDQDIVPFTKFLAKLL